MTKKNGRFELPLRTALLKFEGEYEGAEMRCRLDVPLSLYLEMQALSDSQDPEKVAEAMRTFGDKVLIETNVSIGGKEITPDGDGLLTLPMVFIAKVFEAWSGAIEDEQTAPLAETV